MISAGDFLCVFLTTAQNLAGLTFHISVNTISFAFAGGKQFKKIFATMYIKNITLDDDSQYGILGRYECHAFAVNDTIPTKRGFSVNVITRKYSLP